MMVWTLISSFFLAVLIPGEGQMTPWKKEDLQGHMFSVMSGGEVRFRTDPLSPIAGLTVCMRVLTEKKYYRVQFRFGNGSDEVTYTGPSSTDPHHFLQVKDEAVSFEEFSASFPVLYWPWNSRCFTWESGTGMAQLWFDGKMSIRKGVARGQKLLGQAELTVSGFEGQVSDVYVWDSALAVGDLYRYLSLNYNFPYGSVLNWRLIQYSTSGYAVLEPTYSRPFRRSPPDTRSRNVDTVLEGPGATLRRLKQRF